MFLIVFLGFFYFLSFLMISSTKKCDDLFLYTGWGNHYVSKRKYHLIIPTSDEWKKPLTKDSLKLTSHLMHGVIHCNGFGHLLCINSDDVSNYLSGDQIMDFWDRLCSTLHTRYKRNVLSTSLDLFYNNLIYNHGSE